MEEENEASPEAGPAINIGTLEIELNAISSIESDALSSVDDAHAWTDWMQDTDLDPWSCTPCAPPAPIKLPTLKDLYGWKDVCAHCEKAGVYARSIAKLRPDQFIARRYPRALKAATSCGLAGATDHSADTLEAAPHVRAPS